MAQDPTLSPPSSISQSQPQSDDSSHSDIDDDFPIFKIIDNIQRVDPEFSAMKTIEFIDSEFGWNAEREQLKRQEAVQKDVNCKYQFNQVQYFKWRKDPKRQGNDSKIKVLYVTSFMLCLCVMCRVRMSICWTGMCMSCCFIELTECSKCVISIMNYCPSWTLLQTFCCFVFEFEQFSS